MTVSVTYNSKKNKRYYQLQNESLKKLWDERHQELQTGDVYVVNQSLSSD